MRHRTTPRLLALLAVALVALVGCGDDGDDTRTRGTEPPPGGEIDAEVIHLAEGEPPLDGPPAVSVVEPDRAAELFVEAERQAASEAIADADLEGRVLLGGLVDEGCFLAGGVSVREVDGAVVFHADDLDPQEGEVDCARAVVTVAVVAVDTEDLPADIETVPPTTDPDVEVDGPAAGGDDVLGDVVLLEATRYESSDVPGPGLARDRVDLEAVLGRYGLDEPSRGLLAHVETGGEVLVPFRVGGSCSLPLEVSVVRTEDGLWPIERYDPEDEDIVCDAVVQGLALIAVDADDVEGVTSVDDAPADGPTGAGVVQVVEPLDIGADPLAAVYDEGEVAALPGAPDLDLPPAEGDAVRLAFVVEACSPDTAELVADHDAGTVRAEAQQSGDRVDCDALAPHLVIADLAPGHTDLQPVTV